MNIQGEEVNMISAKHTKESIPEDIKNITREQFLAPENAGDLTHNDLYWLLYRAGAETDSLDAFIAEVKSLLDARLGAGSYILALDIDRGVVDGTMSYSNPRLPKSLAWGGLPGVLPGSVSNYAVSCFVFWG